MSVASAKLLFADSDAYKADTNDDGISPYLLERRRFYTDDGWTQLLNQLGRTSTLYVGNLSFFTTEEQVMELFSRCGPVKRLIMGLNKLDKTPCGFCFVEYMNHADAQSCQRFLSGTCNIDDRVLRADLDPGFEEGRQFGRSRKSGGQRRDDFRQEFDAGRGGWAPPPQKDVYLPLFQDHPVGTTTVAVRDGAPNTLSSSTAAARERAAERASSRSRSRSRERQRAPSPSRRSSRSRSRSRSRSPTRRRRQRSPSNEERTTGAAAAAGTDSMRD